MSLNEKAKKDAQSEYANKSNWFKFREGKNKIRVLVEPMAIYEDYKMGICYTGCGFKGAIKYLSYVIAYEEDKQEDGTIVVHKSLKLMKIPYRIFQYIASLELDEDYKFEGFPMPYDITIDAKDAGTKEVKYDCKPRPVRDDVPQNLLDQLKKERPIPTVIESLKKKNMEKHGATGVASTSQVDEADEGGVDYPEETINPEDIPF